MSRSIHVTYKNVRGLTKKEIDEQAADRTSELRQLGRKSELKKSVKKARKKK